MQILKHIGYNIRNYIFKVRCHECKNELYPNKEMPFVFDAHTNELIPELVFDESSNRPSPELA